MNANAISPKVNPRLKRIQQVSRIVRVIIFVCIISSIFTEILLLCTELPNAWAHRQQSPGIVFSLPLSVIGWAFPVIWYCLLAKLFGLYAKGNIFGADCTRCIKWAGFVCVSGWLLSTTIQVCFQMNDGSLFGTGGCPPIHFTSFPLTFFDVFFIRNIEYVDFGLLVLGIAVVLIAWIMDEGRKIQEEQELTV